MNREQTEPATVVVSPIGQANHNGAAVLTTLINELAEAAITLTRECGADTLLLKRSDSEDRIRQAMDKADALLLIGGGDVHPGEYGETDLHPALYNVDPQTDSIDLALIRAAMARRIPTLGICRGLHVVNVAHGGTLHQHLEQTGVAHRGSPEPLVSHRVSLADQSRIQRIYGATKLTVRSGHHQAVDRLGEGLVASAWADDGIIEAVESADPDMDLVAVQWHPEDKVSDDKTSLFRWLVNRAQARRASST